MKEQTMTDYELIRAAAKAAGIAHVTPCQVEWGSWDPLTDDGDALRLAVAIGLLLCVMLDAGFTGVRLPGEHIGGKYDEVQTHGSDACAATRRAIVRAAANLGETEK